MRRNSARSMLAGLLTILLASSVRGTAPAVHAQSLQYWSDPVNISNSGSSTDPAMVIDSDGVIHVVWVDAIDGYKYAQSADGKVWTPPAKANLPFSAKDDSRPSFFAGPNGLIYIVWRNKKDALLVGQAQSKSLSSSSSWGTVTTLASSAVVAYDALVDSQGALQLSYVTVGTSAVPAGVYYVRVGRGGTSKAANIYSSEYFRSLDSTSAHVRIAESANGSTNNIYIAWDDRPQKRILMTESLDGGTTWGQSSQIIGPDAVTGLSIPFDIDIRVVNNEVILIWQIGQPGAQCTAYSEWSTDGGGKFGQLAKVSDQFAVCTQASEFVLQDKDFSVALFNVLGDISLVAWNGSGWSEPQPQSEIASFLNPVTLDSVILGCQDVSFRNTTLYLVGCDKGNGGDIWFSSRSLGSVGDWFPTSAAWSASAPVTSIDQRISDLSSVAGGENTVHAFWIQTRSSEGSQDTTTVQYARWNNESWSSPVPIVSQSAESPTQLSVKADNSGRLLLAWVDGKSGEIFFSWANAQRASNPGEWQAPKAIPSGSQAISSPDLAADASGRIILAYAIPINEQRGIYLVESTDGGTTWTQPFRVFDAASAGWEIVDQPKLGLTGDGRLHIVFRRYSSYAEQRQSLGLYYSQSGDGGATWSTPEAVSEDPVLWDQIVGYGRSTVHRMWQRSKQSALVTLDQVSQDGGRTWGSPTTVASIDATSSLTTLAIDPSGTMDLLQLSSVDSLAIQDERWDGSAWTAQDPKELYVSDRGLATSIAAGLTSGGNLVVCVAVDYPFLTDVLKNDILSVGKSLELPAVIPTPYGAIIPAAKPIATVVEGTPNVLPVSTGVPSLAGLNDSPSFFSDHKNLVGFALLGGILVLIVAIFRPASSKANRQKKGSK